MKLRLVIDIDDMDYAGLIRILIPHIKRADLPLHEKVIDAAAKPGVIEGFLRFIPKKKQDQMVMGLVNKNRSRIIKRGEKIAEGWGLQLSIGDLYIRPVEEEPKPEKAPADAQTVQEETVQTVQPAPGTPSDMTEDA